MIAITLPVHKVNAKCISTENFRVKVNINECKQGSYFWVDSSATAAHEFAGTLQNLQAGSFLGRFIDI